MKSLTKLLQHINNKGYKSYKQLKGSYQFSDYKLTFDHVQGDPFAAPSRLSIRIPMDVAEYPSALWRSKERKAAFEDYLGRSVDKAISSFAKGNRGIGKSGEVEIEAGGQQVLERNAIVLSKDFVEARITVGLPSEGRTILGKEAEEILFEELPEIVKHSLLYKNLSANEIKSYVESIEDQEALRKWLIKEKLVAFVSDNSVLPRRTGIDDHPLTDNAIGFKTPESMKYEPILPNAGEIAGMGIPEGVTLIVGGGFHGKSTLLKALELGIYNHIPGDGREKVVTNPNAVKIRAEDGRSISDVDISPFINRLPFNRDTIHFTTENASGSSSQTANIVEAIQSGAELLLIDEDTSATNFMIRDKRMQALVSDEKEPITPLLHRIRELYDKHGISSIIVMGGSGDYFDVADTAIMMDSYLPVNVTERTKQLSFKDANTFNNKGLPLLSKSSTRRPDQQSLNASMGRYEMKIDAKGVSALFYGKRQIDLSKVEQIINIAQTRTIGLLIYYYAKHFLNKTDSLREGLEKIFDVAEKSGLDIFSPYKVGNLAMPRLYEVAAAINRIRGGSWR